MSRCIFSLNILLLSLIAGLCHYYAWQHVHNIPVSNNGLSRDEFASLVYLADREVCAASQVLGSLYFDGVKIHQNMVEAKRWFKLGAIHGYPPSQYSLGAILIESGQSFSEGLYWLKKAATQDYQPAILLLESLNLSPTR